MKTKKGYIVGVGSRLDNFQTGLDVIGMTEIPFVSQGADLASGVISLATGDYVGAALSVGSLIPGLGQATGAAKMARRAAKVTDAATTYKGTGKLLEVTKKVETPKPKQSIAQKSEVDAKAAKKEKIKEKEDISTDDTKNETIVGKNLDIRDGVTNQLEGQTLEGAILKNHSTSGLQKSVQKDNYQRVIEQIERGKQINNPTNGFGKNTFGI